MAFILRFLIIYAAIGIGILIAQLDHTPCKVPLVLDDGEAPLAAPIDFSRMASDRGYALQVGKAVAFWLPRMIDFAVMGDMPVKKFIFATDCKTA